MSNHVREKSMKKCFEPSLRFPPMYAHLTALQETLDKQGKETDAGLRASVLDPRLLSTEHTAPRAISPVAATSRPGAAQLTLTHSVFSPALRKPGSFTPQPV